MNCRAIVFVALAMTGPALASAGRIVTAVVPFDTKAVATGWRFRCEPATLGHAVAREIAAQLIDGDGSSFSVVERERIDEVLAEQALAAGTAPGREAAVDAGRRVGAQVVIFGEVLAATYAPARDGRPRKGRTRADEWIFNVTLRARAVEVQTGEWLGVYVATGEFAAARVTGEREPIEVRGAECGVGSLDAALSVAARTVALQLEDAKGSFSLPPRACRRGAVVRVEERRVLLALGTAEGLRGGEVFDVYAIGDELFDPLTGAGLGRDERPVGVVSIVRAIGPHLAEAEMLEGESLAGGQIAQEQSGYFGTSACTPSPATSGAAKQVRAGGA